MEALSASIRGHWSSGALLWQLHVAGYTGKRYRSALTNSVKGRRSPLDGIVEELRI